MTIKLSTGLRASMLDPNGESLGAALTDGQLNIYGGVVPEDADDSIEDAKLISIVSDNSQDIGPGKGLNFDPTTTGLLNKSSAQNWSGDILNAARATFFRFVQQSDTGIASTTEKRLQGTVSTKDADLNLSSVDLFKGETQNIIFSPYKLVGW